MAEELNGARLSSPTVAGWEDANGTWHNVEAGEREPEPDELADSPRVTVSATDQDGDTHYRTSSHLTDDFDMEAVFTDGNYGVEFV